MATLNSLAALDMRDKLLKKGFDSWISIGKARQNVYRVEAGNFSNIKQASLLSARMAQAGFVTRTTYTNHGSRVTLIAGTYQERRTAEKLKKSISSAGFTARITHKSDSQSLYMVRVGKHKTRQEAAREIKALKNAGIPVLGITR